MALDRAPLTATLHNFYEFKDQVVLCVGAGHGQRLDPNVVTAETVLIDRDQQSLAGQNTTSTAAVERRVKRHVSVFQDVNIRGVVVYFEFCLHEMEDPRLAIDHARRLAPEVVIFEHSPGSEWTFHAAEEEKVSRSAQAIAQFPIKRRAHVYAEQTFNNHIELVTKLSTQGDLTIRRAVRFAGATDIVIPMKCTLVLL